jgi:hypothetical protein
MQDSVELLLHRPQGRTVTTSEMPSLDRQTPATEVMYQLILGGLVSQAITAVANLGVADALAGGPLPIDELANKVRPILTPAQNFAGPDQQWPRTHRQRVPPHTRRSRFPDDPRGGHRIALQHRRSPRGSGKD